MSTLYIFLILSLTLTLKSIGLAQISIRFFHKAHGKTQTNFLANPTDLPTFI